MASHNHDHSGPAHSHTHDGAPCSGHDQDEVPDLVDLSLSSPADHHAQPHSHSHDGVPCSGHAAPSPLDHHSHDHTPHSHSHDGIPCSGHAAPDPYTLPASSDEHQIHTTLTSFSLYRRTAHSNLTHARRNTFYSLPLSSQRLLAKANIDFPETLDAIDEAISLNADLLDEIYDTAIDSFGVDPEELVGEQGRRWEKVSGMEDALAKTRTTIKMLYRDWSAEGAKERDVCYTPVLEALEKHFAGLSEEEKGEVEVLVPGAGLGRLAFELVRRGFKAQGNENSFHMLMASNWVLNRSEVAEGYEIAPWLHSFSNLAERADQTRTVMIPDVHPMGVLSGIPNANEKFSMASGDFVRAYSEAENDEAFGAVATVFFLDTATDIVEYVETIRRVLKKGGVWVNFGPLLWHWEGREVPKGERRGLELTADEVVRLVEAAGFKMKERRRGEKGEYAGTGGRGLLRWEYEGEFWVAVKE